MWHREHQIPGVTVCFLHGLELMLLESDVPEVRRPIDPFALPSLPAERDATRRRLFERAKSAPATTRHWAFAKFCANLLSSSIPYEFSRSRPHFLREKLGSESITKRPVVDVEGLSQDIVVRWTAPELMRLGLSEPELRQGTWLRPWLSETQHSAPAFHGLLLLEHCFASAEQLVEEWRDFRRFFDGQNGSTTKAVDENGARMRELLRRFAWSARVNVDEVRPLVDELRRLFDLRRQFPQLFNLGAEECRLSAEAKAIRGAIRTLGGRRSTNYAKIERRIAYIEGCIPTCKQQILAYVSRTQSASRSEVVRKKAPPVPMHVPMTLLGIRKSSTGAASGRRRSRQGTAAQRRGLGPADRARR